MATPFWWILEIVKWRKKKKSRYEVIDNENDDWQMFHSNVDLKILKMSDHIVASMKGDIEEYDKKGNKKTNHTLNTMQNLNTSHETNKEPWNLIHKINWIYSSDFMQFYISMRFVRLVIVLLFSLFWYCIRFSAWLTFQCIWSFFLLTPQTTTMKNWWMWTMFLICYMFEQLLLSKLVF